MLTAVASDDTLVRAYDEGRGPTILLVGPGLDQATRTRALSQRLSPSFRVVRLHRRQYRLDLKPGAPPTGFSVPQEVDDVLALRHVLGDRVVLYGHSSGGVVALEALLAAPDAFAGAVIYEPACMIDARMARAHEDLVRRARAALLQHHPAKAMTLFAKEAVGLPIWQAWCVGALVAALGRYRKLVPCQVDDLDAMVRLGIRLEAYARIRTPVTLVRGERSPLNLRQRSDAVQEALPKARAVLMPGQGHAADVRAPRLLGRVIEASAIRMLAGRLA